VRPFPHLTEGPVHSLLQMVPGLGWELSAWTALLVAAELFEQDLAQSAEVTLASLARTSAGQRLLESALNLLSPLL